MKVKELIKQLKGIPEDYEIDVEYYDSDTCMTVSEDITIICVYDKFKVCTLVTKSCL